MSNTYHAIFIRIARQSALVVGLLLLAGVVYAEIQDRVGVVETTVNVFPGAISSNGWRNTESILSQNLAGGALYQEFNTINSAYLPENVSSDVERTVRLNTAEDDFEPLASSTTNTATTTQSEGESSTAVENETATEETNDEALATSTEAVPTEVLDEAATTTPVLSPAEETATTSSPVDTDDTPATSTATTTAFSRLQRQFSYVFSQAVARLPFVQSSTSTDSPDPTEVSTEQEQPSTEVEDAAESPVASESADTQPPSSATTTDTVDDSTVETESPATSTQATTTEATQPVATSTSTATATTSHGNESAVGTGANTTESDESEDPTTATEPGGSAQELGLTLRDFWLPVFEERDVRITGGQLRVSMAAQKRRFRVDEPARMEVTYSRDNGTTWNSGGTVDITDEISNGINGDYYLFALPLIGDPAELKDLQVRVSFVGQRGDMEAVYIDAAWLEVFTATGSEPPIDPLATFDDNFQNAVLSGDELILPDGEVISFTFTDDNRDENLIIKSDDVRYEGLTKATMYFNVTNQSDRSDEFSVKTYFPEDKGSVTSLEVWQQNKPREVVIPELRPYVYHCAGGWEVSGAPVFVPSESSSSTTLATPETRSDAATTTTDESLLAPAATTTTTTTEPTTQLPSTTTEATTTVSALYNTTQSWVQAVASSTPEAEELVVPTYSCAATKQVRSCDASEAEGTECRVEQERVAEHVKTAYASGWEREEVSTSTENTNTSRLARLGGLLGVAPAVKPVPEEFQARTVTPDTYAIQPGETRYFKMEIAFPPFTKGEFWIEAIGSRAYGLLDPFWNSSWNYKLPISIDNTAATATSTEQHVFLELNASSSEDFWSNVDSDGSDVRFIRETPGNEDSWFDNT